MSNKLGMNPDIQMDADSLGTSGSFVLDSDVYDFVVDMAYWSVTAKKSEALNLHLKTPNGMIHKFQFWMVSGEEKGNKNWYEDKKGTKHYLPGFLTANATSLFCTGKEIGALTQEIKTIKLWNKDAKKEIPTKVEVYTELLDKPIKMAVIKQIVNSNKYNSSTKRYEPSGETREENEVMSVFNPNSNFTVKETTDKLAAPVHMQKWLDKWKGKTRNRETKQNKEIREKKIAATPGNEPVDASGGNLWTK